MKKRPKSDLTPSDPTRFGLASFLDLQPVRVPLLGQAAASFEKFRQELLRDLQPSNAYQCAVADNLIANEWDQLQHRRKRDRVVAEAMASKIAQLAHSAMCDAANEASESAQHDHDDWEETPFSADQAHHDARALAKRARSCDPDEILALEGELEALGVDLVALAATAEGEASRLVGFYNQQIHQLEKRRRELKADFDALQKAAPVNLASEMIEDAEIVE